jgi:glycosyltransferase involved in cell wall biosynthesis
MSKSALKPTKKQKEVINDILIYSDFGCATGFCKVTENLIDYWSKNNKIRIHVFSLSDPRPNQWKYNSKTWVYPAAICPYASPNDGFQRKAFLELLKVITPTVIFFINDIEIVGSITKNLQEINEQKKKAKQLQFKTVFYFPIDSPPRPENLHFLENFDEIATYTNYGKNIIINSVPSLENKLKVVPHGINPNHFFLIKDDQIKLQKENLFGKDKIVFGTVNRNSPRKDISSLIIAFAELKKSFELVSSIQERLVLYLHCNPTDPSGVHLQYLAICLGLEEGKDIFFPKDFSENKGISISELNKLYNCMDVFVTTTTAEGWGLTVTEAMATETLVIAPEHTSLSEILIDDETFEPRALIIPNAFLEPVVFVNDGSKIRYKSKIKDIKDCLIHSLNYVVSSDFENCVDRKIRAKKYADSLSWEKSAKELWGLISKHLL